MNAFKWFVAGGVALGGWFWYTRSSTPTTTSWHTSRTKTVDGCTVRADYLEQWAKSVGKEVRWIIANDPPSKQDAQSAAWSQVFSSDATLLVVVTGNTKFWKYSNDNDAAIPAPELRASYCSFRPKTGTTSGARLFFGVP